ncbi:MAG: recombinase family protein [Defluviitaleaceae bacterium]|nr:recombinase family protein [Defluviitaleaceae bacterium]
MDLMKMRKLLGQGKSIYDLPLRVAYYARVSSDTDMQLNSLDNQITYFDEFIKSNKNWTFAGGYVDEGLSGASVKKRDDFKRMVADGELGKFDLLITKEISRFARDTLDSIQYTRQLLASNVGVFFQADNICTLYSDSELRLTIMASLAQDELRRLSERVKFGMKQAHKAGKVLGQDNMYGYKKSKGKLVVDEKEAKFVHDLYSLYAEDKYGFRTLARILHEKGYRNQSGGEINPGSLKSILSNPKYKGFYHGHITESNDYREQKKVKTALEDRILYKCEEVPAIVSEELWEKVNEILAVRTSKFAKKGRGTVPQTPYSGKVICEEHGTFHYRKMWKDRKIPAESWCCKEYLAKGRKFCATPHLYTRDLDAILEHIGDDLLSNKDKYMASVDNLLAMYEKADNGASADYVGETAKLMTAIKKNKARQAKLVELYTDEIIDRNEFDELNTNLKNDTEQLNMEIARLKEEKKAVNTTAARLTKVKEFFATLSPEKMQATASRQSETQISPALHVAQAMLESVTILKDSTKTEMKIRIDMKLGGTTDCTLATFGKRDATEHFVLDAEEIEKILRSDPPDEYAENLEDAGLTGFDNKNVIKYSQTEISPIVGSEQESRDLVDYFNREMAEHPDKIWELNMFGKSMHSMVRDGLQNKLYRMPDDAQVKMQEALQKIINEGSGGMVCILL